jgi:hypothetical protein
MIAMAPTIDDLSRDFPEARNGTHWQLLSDAVMGGVSAGQMTRTVIAQRPAIRMQGDVSLENNGGFLQIALDLAPGGAVFDASGFAGIAVDVWGNGEEYGLHLRSANLSRPWQSYRMSFAAMPSWQEIRFPFRDFAPHRTDLPFDAHLLRRIGIVAIGRAFTADVAVGGLRFFTAES